MLPTQVLVVVTKTYGRRGVGQQEKDCPRPGGSERDLDPEWWSDERPTASGEADPSPDPSPDPPPGPPPGPPPVPGITWYHGDPGPQCRPTGRGLAALPHDLSPLPRLTGAGQCGIPCNLAGTVTGGRRGCRRFTTTPRTRYVPVFPLDGAEDVAGVH